MGHCGNVVGVCMGVGPTLWVVAISLELSNTLVIWGVVWGIVGVCMGVGPTLW